jgi:hypothetical protein
MGAQRKTPTNHSSSRQDIVFQYVEKYVGIGYVFRSHRKVVRNNCISHLKLCRNHDLNPFAPTTVGFTKKEYIIQIRIPT